MCNQTSNTEQWCDTTVNFFYYSPTLVSSILHCVLPRVVTANWETLVTGVWTTAKSCYVIAPQLRIKLLISWSEVQPTNQRCVTHHATLCVWRDKELRTAAYCHNRAEVAFHHQLARWQLPEVWPHPATTTSTTTMHTWPHWSSNR